MPEQVIVPSVSVTELSPAKFVADAAKFVADMTSLLVDHPAHVAVKPCTDGNGITLVLSVAPDDIGKVIGKQGRTARSLRVILAALSNRAGIRVVLDIQAERA